MGPFAVFSRLYQELLSRIAWRAAFLFVSVHLGVAASITGFVLEDRAWAFAGAGLLYGSILVAVFLIGWPVYKLVRLGQKVLAWRDWILHELPQLIAMLPALGEAMRAFVSGMSGAPRSAPSPGPAAPSSPPTSSKT